MLFDRGTSPRRARGMLSSCVAQSSAQGGFLDPGELDVLAGGTVGTYHNS